jgi:GT2 family glycosyltransferase
MRKSLVSVVLGSYNRYEFLKLTIDSVRKELKEIPHEIIVVDGGSTDGALTWLLEQKDIITIAQHNRGTWQGKAIERRSWGYFMNLGFRAASSKYVCMISDDCLVIPGAIKNGLNLFENELNKGEKIGAVAFYAREWNQEKDYCVRYTIGKKLYVNHGIYLKAALQDVGFINEDDYFFYNADSDLCLKMWQNGYKVIPSQNSFIEHYPHANIKIRTENHKKYQEDGKMFLSKWRGSFYDGTKKTLGYAEYKSFKDLSFLSNRYKKIYKLNLLKNPSLLIPKFKKVIKKIMFKEKI